MNRELIFDDLEFTLEDDSDLNFKEGVVGDEPFIEKTARIFRTCKRGAKNYDVSALDFMVSQFTEPQTDGDWRTPIQLDHSESARDSIGHVRKVWRQGSELFSVLRFVGAEAVTKVKNKTWKRLSSGLRPNFSLREVSVTPFPWHTDTETFKEDPPVSEPTTSTDNINFAERLAEQERKMAEQERLFAERTAALEKQAAESYKMLEAQAQVIRFTELTAMVDKFSENGKTVPVMRDKELAFLKTLDADQIKLFTELKDTQPKFIDLSRKGHIEFKKAPSSDVDPDDEADQMAQDFGIPQKGKKTAAAGKGGC